MHRTEDATRSVDLFGTGKDGFTNGTPNVTPPTGLGADVFNAVQEELAGFIEAQSITLKTVATETYTQLAAAVTARLLSGVTTKVLTVDSSGSPTAACERPGVQAAPTGTTAIGHRYTSSAGCLLTARTAAYTGFLPVGSPQKRSVITASTGGTPFALDPGCTAVLFNAYGSGGGGGAATSALSGQYVVGGGGAAGGFASLLVPYASLSASYDIVINAAGAAGTGTGMTGVGGTGGDTTVAPHGGAAVVTAKGGLGGAQSFELNSAGGVAGGGGGQAGGVGDAAGPGQDGGMGVISVAAWSGQGGSSPFGVGGAAVEIHTANNFTVGNAGAGRASGGGGAANLAKTSTSACAGGSGTAGCVEVIQFF
jgi:hypothetical protein